MFRSGIDRERRATQFELDLVLLVEGLVAKGQALGGHLAGEKLLGERGPLIGQMRLVSDQHEAASETFPAQGVDRLGSRLAGTDDQNG
jgi:hypothetical protein